MQAVRYAIVDGAVEGELLSFLEKVNPPHCCLYSEPIQSDLVALAPYLVEVTSDVEKWLQYKETPWGLYVITNTNMNKLRQHLRRFLQVLIPQESKPVLLRFYDPRNIWDFIAILSEWELFLFIGPIDRIITCWKNSIREQDFFVLRQKYANDSGIRRKMMQISNLQMDALSDVFERRYVDDIAEKIKLWSSNAEKIDKVIIMETFCWLKSQGITDDRSIRNLFHLFYKNNCLSVDFIPDEFRRILCIDTEEGVFKAESLLIRELGHVPL